MSWTWTVNYSPISRRWLAAQRHTTRFERAMAWPRKPKARYFDTHDEAIDYAESHGNAST